MAASVGAIPTMVTFGAVALAVAASLWAFAASRAAAKFREVLAAANAQAHAAITAREAIIEAGQESVMVWGPDAETMWPYGESQNLLDACLKGPDALLLSQALDDLSTTGAAFALDVRSPEGENVAVRGRAIGALAAIWLCRRAPEGLLQADAGAVLDALPVPVWLRDNSLTLSWVNRAYVAAIGADDAEAALSAQTPFASGERDVAAAERAGAQPKEHKTFVAVSGERHPVTIREVPLENGWVVGVGLDGRNLSASELGAQGSPQTEILEGLATAIAVFDQDGRLAFYNRAFARLWNVPEEWLAQHPSHGAVLDRLREMQKLPEQRDYQTWKQERLAATGKGEEGPAPEQWHLPSGQTVRVVAQPHPSGGLAYFYEDISETLALESSYNTLIGVQRATLDSLGEAVAVFGLDGRLKLHNAAFARLWRLDAAQLSGEPHVQKLAEICGERFVENQIWRKLVESIASGAERRHDWGNFERSDHLVLSVALVPLPDGAMLVTFTDVTDRFRAEAALRERNQALLAADELKSEFVQHASFLFRNPLNAVLGFGDLLSGGHAGALNSKQRDYVQNILAAGRKLAEITSDILDLAMIESGDMRLELARVDLHKLLSRAAEPFRQHALARDIAFRFEVPEDVGVAVLDERRIRQIVFNLLSNAVRYTPNGGEITVGASVSADEVQISVSDSGPGVAAEVQPKVFGRFESKSHNGQRGGAGLGLALVNSFVALHGGWIEMETGEGRGTIVRCHLPRRLSQDPASTPQDIHAA